MSLLEGKKILITGARKGIGRGIAYKVAQEGADVGVNDYIDDDETHKTANLVESLGRKCSTHIYDVSKKTNIDKMVDEFLEFHGNIDVLVNNAIMQPQNKPFFEIDEEWWDYMMDLSLKGYFFAAQKASKEMIKRKTAGSIICISSVHSYRAAEDWTPYGIAKIGTRRMVKGLAADLANTGINANCIAPGWINNTIPKSDQVEPESMPAPWVPAGRQGLPSDIANAVVFLSSKMGEYVNGETLLVDGGMIATGLGTGRPND
jgi:glucose 1-dehydrogenase